MKKNLLLFLMLFSFNANSTPNINDLPMTVTYQHNWLGERTSKTVNGETIYFIYHNRKLISEIDKNGNTIVDYVYLHGEPVAQIRDKRFYYYFNDHLGTPHILTDEKKSTKWVMESTPFGKPFIQSYGIEQNLRFKGQYWDKETDTHYNYYRDYNPELGRYMQPDPIGLSGGNNLFAYAGSNPLRYVDPYGLEAWVLAVPNDQGGLDFQAYDNLGGQHITGNFNNNTINTNQLRSGKYTVTPRKELPMTITNVLLNRNKNKGNPTISNTTEWNTVRYDDGHTIKGAQFHEGVNGSSLGASKACMVSNRATNDSLRNLFFNNYNNGGVHLIIY